MGKFRTLISRFVSSRDQDKDKAPPSRPLSTFHLFQKLPIELRFLIWEYHIDRTPRIFEISDEFIHYEFSNPNPQHVKVTLYTPSCPLRIPFPAAICQELRHEMSKTYRRVEFRDGFAWINFKTDTILISSVSHFRFLLSFNDTAFYNNWFQHVEKLAVCVERFFELQLITRIMDSKSPLVARNKDEASEFCWRESGIHFRRRFNNWQTIPYRNYGIERPEWSFLNQATSWFGVLDYVPKITKIFVIHRSDGYPRCDIGTLPGPLNLVLDYFHSENLDQSDRVQSRKTWAAIFLREWQTGRPHLDKLELEHVGMTRNGLLEDSIPQLTLPYLHQCQSSFHKLRRRRRGPCPCFWGLPVLPPGMTEHRPDRLGPNLTDANGSRIPFFLTNDILARWKLGRKTRIV